HLLEHMLFKGTQKHGELGAEIKGHGGSYNGSTSFDRTNYFETFPATDDNLHWAIDMEADRMVNSRVSREDLDSEMTVVRNEFEMGENNPGSVLFSRMVQAAYAWHNYGNPIIGERTDIEKVPIDKLQAFYRTWYQPDNAVLLVAGRFDEARALERVAQHFSAIPKPSLALPAVYADEPTQHGAMSLTPERVGDPQMPAALCRAMPASR